MCPPLGAPMCRWRPLPVPHIRTSHILSTSAQCEPDLPSSVGFQDGSATSQAFRLTPLAWETLRNICGGSGPKHSCHEPEDLM